MKKLLLLMFAICITFSLMAKDPNGSIERRDINTSPSNAMPEMSRELWDNLLQFDVNTPTGQGGLAGVEWDGMYFYATKWSDSDQLFKFDAEGNYIEAITVPFTDARDLAFDGEYMYGSAANSTVYCWESQTGVAVPENNIEVTGQSVRAIAYDPLTDTFWSGNWGDPVVNWGRDGVVINTLTFGTDLFGLAFDPDDPDGPFLYAHQQTPYPACTLQRIDPETGEVLESTDVAEQGGEDAVAGGLCYMNDWDPALRTLGALMQGTPDYICVYELGINAPPDAPAAPDMFTVTPDPNSGLTADLGWMNPTETVMGDDLTDLDEMHVYRNDELIHTITDPVIGGVVNWTDNLPEAGNYNYSAVGFNDAGEGIPASSMAYIGEDVPAEVTGIMLANVGGNGELSWTNPTMGLHGGPFNEPILGYHIVRTDDVSFEVAGLHTTWTDDTIPEEGLYAYTITPYNSIGDGGSVSSEMTWIGDSQAAMFGDPNTTTAHYYTPINFWYKNSLSETIYYADEFAAQGFGAGTITGIIYYNNFENDIPGKSINIWMQNTTLDNLSGGWVPATDMIQVFSGTLDFPIGINEIIVDLDEPFIYEGQNLIIFVEKVMDNDYYSENDIFYYTDTQYTDRCLWEQSDGDDYDPYNPPTTANFVSSNPNTMMFINTTGLGQMQGYAYNEDNNEPLEGVLIELMEQRIHTFTDANGHYSFPGLLEGTYEAHATLFAHSEEVEMIIIDADETTDQDFFMHPVPEVEVTGRVVGSDYPDIGLENAMVTLSGMGVHEGLTDEDGYFNINTVYAYNTYQLVAVAEGYEVLVGEAEIGATNTDLGNIIVNEIVFPAYDVIATQNDEGTIVDLVWHGPNPAGYNFWDFENDDGEFVANTGWAWGTDTMAGAYSGDNVWGTTLNEQYSDSANYELVTPEMRIPSDDAVLTFWHWMDMENYSDGGNIKVSTDGGTNWALINPVGGYPGTAWGLNNNEACFTGYDQTWTLVTFEIGAYQGEDVMFKFHFGSDECITYQGWYIDDVYVGMPEDRLMHPNNPNFRPVANLLPHNNERILETYNLYRLLLSEEELPENWDMIALGLADTVYTDPTWENVESDIYKYAVIAEYTNEITAEAAISNWVARDYYTNATVSIYDFFGNPVVDAEAKFMCQTPDPDEVLNEYELLTDTMGEGYFPMIWKGDYNIRVTKENMATYEDEMVPIYEPYTLEIQLTENLNHVIGLDYIVLDDDVTLWWNEPADEAFFDFEADNGDFTGDTGWEWANGCNQGTPWSGDNCWSAWPGEEYSDNANSSLYSAPVPIPGDEAQLTFYHYYDTEDYFDGGNIKISVDDGSTWEIITPEDGYTVDEGSMGNFGIPGEPAYCGNSGGWVLATFNVGQWAGEEAIFRFHFGSDSGAAYSGWDIDDVRVGTPIEDNRDRLFQHYNIYRNGNLLADEVVDLEYTDIDVPDGTYTYGITAFYDSGESEVEEVVVDVYPLDITGYVTASDTPETTPFEDVAIILENDHFFWETVTDANGEFIISSVNGNQTYTITASYEGYQTWSEEVVVTGEDIDYDMITLQEIINSPYNVLAEVNTEDTECDLTWNSPGTWSEYEIIYDDDEAENSTAWYDPDNERAVWFTAQGVPCWITGGSMHIYDGTYPEGNVLTPFTACVWAYDDDTGLPGELLGSVEVTPTDYYWVPFTFDTPIPIDGTEFFLGYAQGGVFPDCAPIGVDDTDPTMGRSYEHYVTDGDAWAISDYQDYMLRAIIQGPTGRQVTVSYDNPVVDFSNITPHKGAASEHAVNLPQGIQEVGTARYMPIHNTNPFSTASNWDTRRDRELLGYNIIRGDYGDEPNWEMWEPMNVTLVEDTVYTDLNWVNLEDGTVYTYGVRSVYTNDNMSDPSFSNWVGKDMYASLEVALETNIGDIPAGAVVTLEATEPDPDGNYPEYEGITDDQGECTITGIWKGNYNLEAELMNYATLEDNIEIMENVVIYEGMITEMIYPAFEVYAEVNQAGNTDIIWHSPSGALNSFFDFEDDDGEFIGDAGWEWANGCNAGNAWSGENCWSAWPGEDYSDNANSSLYTPEINIPSDETQLIFYHWYDIESYCDGGNVKTSLDEGESWTIIEPINGYPGTAGSLNGEGAFTGNSGDWVMAAFDLSMYDGEEVMFRFHFGSDSSVSYCGWDIDDVYIGEPENRGCPIQLFTSKQTALNSFSKASETDTRLERLDGYTLLRGFADDTENFEAWDLIAETIPDTTYEDVTWSEITEAGVYMYCVRSEYTGDVLSDPSFSNYIGFDMYASLEVALETNIGDIPVGVIVTLEATEPDPDGNYLEYVGITDDQGECTITGIWKGNYNLEAELMNFATLEDNIEIMENVVIYEGMLTEMTYPAFDVYAEVNQAGNADIIWHSPAGALNPFFDFEDNDGEFVGETGWQWANGCNADNAWSGENCWSTWPGIDYLDDANTSLYSPVIDVLSDEAQLIFHHWYDTEGYCDGGNVKISLDEGATWTIIEPIGGYPGIAWGLNGELAFNGNSGDWLMAAFDLSMYDGEEVMFRFHFGSDSGVAYSGWDIDDVYIGEPENRGCPIRLFTNKETALNSFSKASETDTRLERLEGYSIFRGLAEDEANFENWTLIASSVQDTTYEDTSWDMIGEEGNYEYCVRVEYLGDVLSEPAFSNLFYNEGIDIIYGDVTGDLIVDAFDAANILQYTVGLNPVGAPLPWTWQLIAGNVDGIAGPGAYDAALVLQYSVGMIDIFPVETREVHIYPSAELSIVQTGNELIIAAQGELHSFLFDLNIDLTNREISITNEEALTCVNGSKMALASALPINSKICRIILNDAQNLVGNEISGTINGIDFTVNIEELPEVTTLNAIYPNPFNPVTNIQFSLCQTENVKITVYNLKGQKVAVIFNEEMVAGNHIVSWNAQNTPSGIYFLNFNTNTANNTQKVVLLK